MPLLLPAVAAGYTAGPGWEIPVCFFICPVLKRVAEGWVLSPFL